MTATELSQFWCALRASVDDGIRMIPIGTSSSAGPINAGVDGDGRLHLLVPVELGTKTAIDHRSAAVTVSRRDLIVEGRRRLFVDVECVNPELGDVFERFAAEICERIAVEPTQAPTMPATVLAKWRRLLEGSAPALSRERLAGLFGELYVLREMVNVDPAARIDLWQIGGQSVHDFVRDGMAVEVKTTLIREGRRVEIHGIDQLQVPQDSLHLAFLRLRADAGGDSVGDLVRAVRSKTSDPEHLDKTLEDFGWIEDGNEPARFCITEERWHVVDSNFPRLTRDQFVGALLPDGVLGLRYTIDLSGPAPAPLSEAERATVVERVATA